MGVEGHKLSFLENGIDQIAIVVEDLDEAVETYWRMLGVGPWSIYTYGRPLVRESSYRGQPTDFAQRIALAQVGGLRIELIETVKGPTIYADFAEEHGYGLHHIGVLVDDMQAALAEAREAGLMVTMEGSGFGLDGDGHYAYLSTEELLGTCLELIEVPKRRAAPEMVYPPEDAGGTGDS
jgi:catechol 2,3-dioxygenase-like lactoylglutathione lyase family enzyme